MGLFSGLFGGSTADDFCPICGAKLPSALLPFNGAKKLADGRICSDCAAQFSPFVSGTKHMTVNDAAAHLQYRNENYQALQLFTETHSIQAGGITIALDWNRQQILFSTAADYRSANADLLTLPQVTAIQYEINESHYTQTRDLKDGNGPQKVPVYNYGFRFIISVNHPWFSTIEFYVNNRSSVDLTNQDVLADCIADGDKLYSFLSSIGFPCTFTDNTTCGIDSLRDGTAMSRLMPPPPPPQPEAQAHDAMAMGAAAGMVMEQGRREPQPARMPEQNMRETPRPAENRRGNAEQARPASGRGPMQQPDRQTSQGKSSQNQPRNQAPQNNRKQGPSASGSKDTKPGMNDRGPSDRGNVTVSHGAQNMQSGAKPGSQGMNTGSKPGTHQSADRPDKNTETRPSSTSRSGSTGSASQSSKRKENEAPSGAGSSATNRQQPKNNSTSDRGNSRSTGANNSRDTGKGNTRASSASGKDAQPDRPTHTERSGRPDDNGPGRGSPMGGPGRR